MALELEQTYGSMGEAVTVIGNTPKTLLIDETYDVRATVITPMNISFLFAEGALVRVKNGVTLTIRGKCTWLGSKKSFILEGSGQVFFENGQGIDPAVLGAMGDTTNGIDGTDDTLALQQTLTATETDAAYKGGYVDLQGKKYKTTAPITNSKRDWSIKGKGRYNSVLYNIGVAGGCIVAGAINYNRPFLMDFSIEGNSGSGPGIDFSATLLQTYSGEISRLGITSGGPCIYAPQKFFSFTIDNVQGTSKDNHTFQAHMGPSVVWKNCYAVECGSAKAGYRLSGGIYLDNCNGVNTADHWGVFGSDTGGTADGFESDFPVIAYPDVTMINCNVESFVTRGIYFCQSVIQATIIGGKIDRNAFATAYHSLISWKKNPVSTGGVTRVRLAYLLPGTGVPNGGAALTTAWLHTLAAVQMIDESGVFASAGITGIYSTVAVGMYPLQTMLVGGTNQSFQTVAHQVSAASIRRLTCEMVRFATGAVLTPIGAGQAIVVTGLAKVIVTPAAAASITTATFVSTLGVISDSGRNGDLIIEAGNANLTINHTALGGAANTFVMAAGANLAMGSGFIVRFLRSETTSQWIQY